MAGSFLDRVSNMALGELLVEKGALSEAQVGEALDFSRSRGVRLGEALVALGYISRDALGYAIGEQYGLKPMELQPSMVDADLVSRFDFDLLSAHTMLPLIQLEQELVVVVSDPNNQEGLVELARRFPNLTITPQLGAAAQIRRCLDGVRPRDSDAGQRSAMVQPPEPRREAHATSEVARTLPFFKSVPDPASPEFADWLVGLAATHKDRDVLVRDLGGVMQVCLTPSAAQPHDSGDASSPDSDALMDVGHTEIGRWPGGSAAAIRDMILQRATPLEHTRDQAARWSYSVKHGGHRFDFLILMPIVHKDAVLLIRALTHLDDSSDSDAAAGGEFSAVPMILDLQAGKYTVVLYDASESLEQALAYLMDEKASEHSFVVAQYVTRCVFPHAQAYPAPFANMVTAAQAMAATCVIFDHPVEYREAVRLLTSTFPPPAVLVCAPLPSHESGAGTLAPDVEELISRQGAQSVRLNVGAGSGAANSNMIEGDL